MAQLSVMVVDDDVDIREYLQDFLAAEGFQVTAVPEANLALQTLKEQNPHVVILDLMMPSISGVELLEQIRASDEDVAVIVLTGFPSVTTAQSCIPYGISAYLQKPFQSPELLGALQRVAKQKGLLLSCEEELHATIGRNIRELRKTRGLTLKQMARRTELSVSLLSQIERAESSASVSSLFKVATALEVKLTELFGSY